MASIKQSTVFNFPKKGGLGFELPQSNVQFSWRDDPSVISCREFIRNTIQAYLACNASGEFVHQTAELAAYLENQLFIEAFSKEDYMDQGNFYNRLLHLIQLTWCQAKSAQQEAKHTTTLLPTYDAIPTQRMLKKNYSANSDKPLHDCIMTADTVSNFLSLNNSNQPHLLADLPRSSVSESRKRTFDMTLPHPEEVILDNYSPCGGISNNSEPVDSVPTFSGSVLQYDSDASFGSHCTKSEHFDKGEFNLIIPNSQSSSSVHTSIKVRENSKLETRTISDEVHVQQAVLEPPNFQPQPSQLILTFDEHSGEEKSCGRILEENSLASHDARFRGILISCCDGFGQHTTSRDIWKGSADKLLSCCFAYNRRPLTRGEGKVPFSEYLHSQKCNSSMCSCEEYKLLFSHFDNCGSAECGICGPSKRICSINAVYEPQTCDNGAWLDTSEDFLKPTKCRKLSTSPNYGSLGGISMSTVDPVGSSAPLNFVRQSESPLIANHDIAEANMEMVTCHAHDARCISEAGKTALDDSRGGCAYGASPTCEGPSAGFKQDGELAEHGEIKDKVPSSCYKLPSDCVPSLCEENFVVQNEEDSAEGFQHTAASVIEIKSEKQKVEGISLTDFFTSGEIRQHISSLRQRVDQATAEEVAGSSSCSIGENFCQLCALDRLAFPPMPIYCSTCGVRIKNHGTFYSSKDGSSSRLCFCTACYNKCRGVKMTFYGFSIPKINLVMKKNNLVTEESWVQCDKCEGWQHQICALFNDKRDLGGKAKYVCPKCYLEDVENERHMPLPRSTAFDAKNLPQTKLSNHIEERLFRRIKQDREDRAKAAGKNLEEVPEPADLVVRVVSSVDKRLKVKQRFLDIFPDKNYPAEFPYRSKVILLFQRIEGVDVCLFAMYVQEFGSECSLPNQRCVYLSYLDSVKYLRPETKARSGESLRTFVYHEILVAYLDYCKKRGFTTCYIWACPPLKGEDYILYCHPETQKTPRPEKLRQWYQSMLKKASNEKIIMNFSNLYEQFFVPTGECNTKVTAARVPYFDGDYWSSVAESVINKIEQESKGEPQKKVEKMTRRSLKAMGHSNPSANDAKDILLMQELGQNISSSKEDFIIVYLQFVCTHCHDVILSGKRWFCHQCKNYQLCGRCLDTNQTFGQGNTHVSSSGQKHALSQEMVNDVPVNTEDHDSIIDSCFLENRHAFLSFCQGNHYQFDSLRRAKHSSMMILYHIHNPIISCAGTFCTLCLKDLVADSRWKCEICPDFNVCDPCYQRNSASCHNHTLTCHPATASSGTESKMAKSKMVRLLLDVVLHASRCQTTTGHPCSYPNCTLIRRLFFHARACNVRVAGGCHLCKNTWLVLMMHSRRCKDFNCGVPRCMDLKKYAGRLELESKTRQEDTIQEFSGLRR